MNEAHNHGCGFPLRCVDHQGDPGQATPQLNDKVERSHRSDEQEFYQLHTYKGDINLEAKLDESERFYNFHRPHGAFNRKTSYEALREKLQ